MFELFKQNSKVKYSLISILNNSKFTFITIIFKLIQNIIVIIFEINLKMECFYQAR